MKKLIYLLFSIIFIIFLVPRVYALENYDSYYEFTITDDYYERNITFGTTTLIDFYSDLISYYDEHSSFYHMIIQSDTIYLIPKSIYSNNTLYFDVHGANSGRSNSFTSSEYFNNVSKFIFPYNGSTWNILTTNWYNHLKDCLNGSSCNTSSSSAGFIYNYGYNEVVLLDNRYATISPFAFNNTDNFSMLNYQPYYYSSTPLMFRSNSNYVNLNTTFYKTLNYYNNSVSSNEYLYGYLDSLNFNQDDYNLEQLGTLFIGNIPVSDISNFSYNGSFYYTDYDYAHSLEPLFSFFGRVNHTSYYSYERLTCSSDIYSSFAINQEQQKVTFTLLPNGFSCTNTMSNYDYVYIRVDYRYNINSNYYISGYSSNFNYGQSYRLKDTLVTFTGVDILENFNNLSSDFSYVLSTLEPEDKAYYISENIYVNALNLDLTNNNYVESASYNPISYGQSIEKNAIIYNLEDYYSGDTNLKLFIDESTIVSPYYNNSYTYYDNNGSLDTSNIINNRGRIPTNSYDTTYYRNIVANYISDLSSDIDTLSLFTQKAYDVAPISLQTFIFVTFILVCFYFTYILIKR